MPGSSACTAVDLRPTTTACATRGGPLGNNIAHLGAPSFAEIKNRNIQPQNAGYEHMGRDLQTINRANRLVRAWRGVHQKPIRNVAVAEAKFICGLMLYFDLVRYWNDVP
jgi:hypothetical protein